MNMAIEYLGLSRIQGPLVVLEGVQNAFYDEIVEFTVDKTTKKQEGSLNFMRIKQSFRYLRGQKICHFEIPIPV
jgi:vacuolar-type H+-ATPase subunit B/Vma2